LVPKKNITKKLGRHWYKNDPAIITAIQFCVVWGFSTKRSLKYLFENHGCNMDERTFRRIKQSLSTSNTQRLNVITDETITFFHESLGDLLKTKNVLVNIIMDPNTSVALKVQASTALGKNLTTMVQFYDSSQVIAGISKLKEENENAIQKLAKVP